MSAFKRFGPGDQIDNVLVLEPSWVLASGSSGWRGSPEGSASVSLYGGYNRQPGGVVQEYRFQRTIQGTDSFGVLARSEPITASVNYVYMTSDERGISERNNTRWGYEHWKTVSRLFDYYERRSPDYVTSSYDHYCLFFNSGSNNIVSIYDQKDFAGNTYVGIPTGSFTLEAWFKPMSSGSVGNNLTIVAKGNGYKLFIDGDSGRLCWSMQSGSSLIVASVTSSAALTLNEWHHAAVTFDSSTRSGTLYQDLTQVGSFVYPGYRMKNPNNFTGSFHIGAEWGGTITQQGTLFKRFFEDPTISAAGLANTVFHGFIGNVRLWGTKKTLSQLSGTHNVRLTGSALGNPLLMDIRLSEGPLSDAAPDTDVGGTLSRYLYAGKGSGTMNWAAAAQGVAPDFGGLYGFNRSGPVWHPNDNPKFYVQKEEAITFASGTGWYKASNPVQRMRVVSVPQGISGRGIVPNSVRMTDKTWNDPTVGLVRTLVDDGRGGLYLSGTVGHTGSVAWNKVGNVFYSEGLIVIKDPAMLDFADPSVALTTDPTNIFQLEFRGQSRVPVKTLMCRIDRGELNASLNPTFYRTEEDGDRVRRHPSGSVYVTTVGIYNSDRELVGVARLAEPLRVRPRDRMNIKLRMDF